MCDDDPDTKEVYIGQSWTIFLQSDWDPGRSFPDSGGIIKLPKYDDHRSCDGMPEDRGNM